MERTGIQSFHGRAPRFQFPTKKFGWPERVTQAQAKSNGMRLTYQAITQETHSGEAGKEIRRDNKPRTRVQIPSPRHEHFREESADAGSSSAVEHWD